MEPATLIAATVFCVASASAGVFAAIRVARKTAQASLVLGENAESVLKSADRRRGIILDEAVRAAREQFEDEARRLDDEREVVTRLQEDYEQELNERQSELDKMGNELDASEAALQRTSDSIADLHSHTVRLQDERGSVQKDYVRSLSARGNIDVSDLAGHVREEVVNAERLGVSRWLIEHQEGLRADARRYARDVLNVVYSRYNPTFVWPKTSFAVETPSKSMAEKHFGDDAPLLKMLVEGTDTSIDLLASSDAAEPPTLKISGGAGVDKEVIRLTLEDVVARNQFNPDKVRALISKHRANVDRLTLKMGEDAVKILDLPAMHPEICKLIGALNFRTSHRQNQYFHSLEVARLAGMLADEVGVDPRLAKRAGILHDIGKVLDYKIEGSHAVISGDYAQRFGEPEDVVDTVLSHHDDKIVETAHAYILKAADAMSGARPGARVDMEEGYQKRIEGIADVIKSFQDKGVVNSAIMHAGREVHVFVDNRRIKERDIERLASDICRKLESDVQFPGQIRVTVVRRMEVTEVA